MATPTSRLKLKKQTLGSNLNQWGLSGGLNGAFDQVDVLAGYLEVNLGSATSYTFGTTNYATTGNEHMYRAVKFSGSPASGVTVNIPAVDDFKFVENATGQTITFSNGATTATLANTFTGYIRTNGSSVITVLTLPDGINVKTVADNIASVNTTATNISNVNTVAGISANVTTTAGIAGNVTTVAGIASDVTGVAGISSAVSGVNAIASDVTAVNTDPLKTNIGNVSGNATNINAVAGNATNINTVAGINANVTTVAGISSDVTGVNAVASDVTGVNAIASNVTTVAGVASNVTTVAGISGDVTGVNAISSAVTGVNTISAAVSSVNSNATNINAVAGNSTNINAVNSNATNINTVAGISSNVTTVATNVTDVNNFADLYQIASSPPSTDGGGNALSQGDLYFDTAANELKVWNGSAFQGGVTATGNFLLKSNNLNDLASAATARTNLGLDPLLAAKAPLASPALTGSPTVNGVAIATGSTELGTLTQAFSAGQQTTINLSANALSPSVAVTKEVPQVGITNNQWNVNSSSPNYTRYNSAPATTLDFVGYNTSTVSFEKSFSVSAQESGVLGMAFSADGTKMYIIGDNGDDVNQYALSTAWDIGTASYEKVFSVSSQETVPQSVRFSTDGTRMFIAGDSWNSIFQYNLSTGFDVGTASYSNNSLSVASQDSSPHGLAFNNDGTKMYVVGGSNDTIYQYTLTTGWDLSTASYASLSFSVAGACNLPKGIAFNADGTKLYLASQFEDKIIVYSLSTAFNITTLSLDGYFDTSSQNSDPTDVAFAAGGSKLYMLGESGSNVYQYDLPLSLSLGSGSFASGDVAKTIEANSGKFVLTATSGAFATITAPANYNQVASGSWQMYGTKFDTVATDLELSHTFVNAYANGVFSYTDNSGLGNSISEPQGLCFGNNGTKFYIMCSNQQKIYEFNLSTAFDVTTRSLVNSFSTSSNFSQGSDFIITPDGTRIFLTQTQGGRIDTYELTTPFDITTCSNFAMVRNMNSTDSESTPTGICFSPDGTNMYVVGAGLNRVYHLSLSTGYDPSSTIAMVSETSVGSIDPTAITIKPDGSRFFIYSDSSNAVKIYDTSTAFSFSSASYTTQYTATNSNMGRGLAFNSTGSQLNIIDTQFEAIYRYDTATLSAPSGYHAAHTTTSIDSTYWTDINSMTANETAGSGTVNYAVSTDDRTTWKIAHNSNGVRSIVKNDSGTWKYNSNATYGSETWTNGATNNELATIQEAMGTAQNRMDKTQLEAVSDANHFPVSNDLDLAIILNLSSGSGIPSSDGVSINYDAAVANQGAILGTDYNYDVPALNKVRITAVNAATLKVRVV